ncbi:uncharacterized protein LOC115453122 isoform X2 [Manduca sexta]|uniref:uncharacterized protein LOC115453122 isoform X2 n=1 Tax=Manduca sexta TaxID=7130 RepID=UPI00188F9C9D|nr:uncharacterized protein LOC115453122 isoform X2 [Manduca sexta]
MGDCVKEDNFDQDLHSVKGNSNSEPATDRVVPPPPPPPPRPRYSPQNLPNICLAKRAHFSPHAVVTTRLLQLAETERERVTVRSRRQHLLSPPPAAPPLPRFSYPQRSDVLGSASTPINT